jgi:GT2 family glycosyltransferase
MNIAIAQATGDIVVRMDAHVVYPAAYLTRLVTALDETGAENVGARLVTVPAGPGPLARAIAIALSHPLGVGNSHHRLAGTVRRWVDTVPFGCYRRDVFGRLGGFDEDLVRNQDDEFNARLIRQGGRVLLLPDLTARYYARPGLRQLWRMYYQYGLFKPLVARKVRRLTTWRQLVPAAFVAGLAAAALASLVRPAALPFLVLPALAYAAVVMVTALGHARAEGLRCALGLMLAFPTLHVSYGVGFLRGLWRAVITPKAVIDPAAIPLSR